MTKTLKQVELKLKALTLNQRTIQLHEYNFGGQCENIEIVTYRLPAKLGF